MAVSSGGLDNTGVELERQAYGTFGAAVDSFSKQSASSRPSGATLAGNTTTNGREFSGVWAPTNYASDLIEFAPKHRFMFKVMFQFTAPYQTMNGPHLAKNENNVFTFMIKQIDRPSIDFEYEDVNFYNYKSKILTKINHQPLAMVFYDDIQNYVIDFFNKYRLAYSPIGRMNSAPTAASMEEDGMKFSTGYYGSSVGPLSQESSDMGPTIATLNVLQSITVRQIFAHGTRAVDFVFVNPRITNFDFDEVDHEAQTSNGLTVRFDYDSLYLKTPAQQEFMQPARNSKTDILNSGNLRNAGSKGPDMNAGGSVDGMLGSPGQNKKTANNTVRTNVPGGAHGQVGESLTSFTKTSTGNTLRNASNAVEQALAQPESLVSDNTTNDSRVKSSVPVLYI